MKREISYKNVSSKKINIQKDKATNNYELINLDDESFVVHSSPSTVLYVYNIS